MPASVACRFAIAPASIKLPGLIDLRRRIGHPVLLADEPTGNLDPETAERVFAQLVAVIRAQGVAALIATHNMELAHRMNRILRLGDGLLHEVEARAT